MKEKVFLISFVIASLLIGIRLFELDILDTGMWTNQAMYVETGDERQFNPLYAYGHPGGTIILGTILLKNALSISYDTAIFVFLTTVSGLLIAGSSTLAYLLSTQTRWWIAVLGILSLNRIYDYVTPTTLIASLLIVFLQLLVLYQLRHRQLLKLLIPIGITAGLVEATRFDIGVVFFLLSIISLKQIYSWQKILAVSGITVITFLFTNPFMWFMPFTHIGDLISKITYHYGDFMPNQMSFREVLSMSGFTFLSILLLGVILIKLKNINPIPQRISVYLIGLTLVMYSVFLSANIQTPRYFTPLILIWEILLPLFIFSLIPFIKSNFLWSTVKEKTGQNVIELFILLIVIGSHTFSFLQSVFINSRLH